MLFRCLKAIFFLSGKTPFAIKAANSELNFKTFMATPSRRFGSSSYSKRSQVNSLRLTCCAVYVFWTNPEVVNRAHTVLKYGLDSLKLRRTWADLCKLTSKRSSFLSVYPKLCRPMLTKFLRLLALLKSSSKITVVSKRPIRLLVKVKVKENTMILTKNDQIQNKLCCDLT